jgi:hypothetical protein
VSSISFFGAESSLVIIFFAANANLVFGLVSARELVNILRQFGSERRENFFIPNHLFRISLTVDTVARKCWIVIPALENGNFWKNASDYVDKFSGHSSVLESLSIANRRS